MTVSPEEGPCVNPMAGWHSLWTVILTNRRITDQLFDNLHLLRGLIWKATPSSRSSWFDVQASFLLFTPKVKWDIRDNNRSFVSRLFRKRDSTLHLALPDEMVYYIFQENTKNSTNVIGLWPQETLFNSKQSWRNLGRRNEQSWDYENDFLHRILLSTIFWPLQIALMVILSPLKCFLGMRLS